ncbi:response regulator [Pseudomonas vlassakiae]|jgi:FixJ family two-component response regulator/DNA-binding winged helix-turn-helix (wHTH) protein|uniref:response regulator n=1 Tax=Pseudomonas TaxID=286 RepID=UPI000C195E3A|nr:MULTISPECIES: response regulator [unclassified Pseudomonas]AXQ50277.1 response regulator [Stenotrophomonas rhizophila]MBS3187537.1 response regulator [Pseudomonas sp. PCH44]PIK80077.1 LuxR family transcriptional regulator [Pseudomonas sp. 382]
MIRIGNAQVSLERREAFLDGKPILLGGRAFEVLATLIKAKGRVVGKDELFSQVWAGTVVEDNNLQVQVSLLRKAFGDRGLIQTVPRRGYRLAAQVSFDVPCLALGQSPLCAKAETSELCYDVANVPVLVVDDDPSVRKALGRLLGSRDIPHQLFASAEALFDARLESPCACLLLDMHLAETTGLEVQATLRRLALPWPIMFMTGFGTIPMTVQAMRAGAVEFLTKPFDEDQLLVLLDSVRARAVIEGRKWQHARQVEEKYQHLTQRERQVFSLVVGGLSHKQIAREIGTSEVTTKVHKKNIMNKMQSRSLLELVAMHNVIDARPGA